MALVLKRGDNNEAVLVLQKLLVARGETISGLATNFGPQTERAVKSFQQKILAEVPTFSVDGVVGQHTWNYLAKVQRGDVSPVVKILQELLNEKGYSVGNPVESFGPRTEARVKEVQTKAGIMVDGVAGARVWDYLLSEQDDVRELHESDILKASEQSGLEVAWIKAIIEIESGPYGGFFSNGYPTLLFERHWMRRRCLHQGLTTLVNIVSNVRPDLINDTWGGYAGGLAEVKRFQEAIGLNREAALESASYGLFQIMGFHWENLGFDSVEEFYSTMCESEGKQLEILVKFIQADKRLYKAALELDFNKFARIYNGPAYEKNNYHNKLRNAYERYKAL